jgi:hypothetical protein
MRTGLWQTGRELTSRSAGALQHQKPVDDHMHGRACRAIDWNIEQKQLPVGSGFYPAAGRDLPLVTR